VEYRPPAGEVGWEGRSAGGKQFAKSRRSSVTLRVAVRVNHTYVESDIKLGEFDSVSGSL
jgi:hypothetical protein